MTGTGAFTRILYKFAETRNLDVHIMEEDATYICDSCGEEIVVPIDVTAGRQQEYVEDCPVCCHPNVIYVAAEDDGSWHLDSESES